MGHSSVFWVAPTSSFSLWQTESRIDMEKGSLPPHRCQRAPDRCGITTGYLEELATDRLYGPPYGITAGHLHELCTNHLLGLGSLCRSSACREGLGSLPSSSHHRSASCCFRSVTSLHLFDLHDSYICSQLCTPLCKCVTQKAVVLPMSGPVLVWAGVLRLPRTWPRPITIATIATATPRPNGATMPLLLSSGPPMAKPTEVAVNSQRLRPRVSL